MNDRDLFEERATVALIVLLMVGLIPVFAVLLGDK